MNKEEITDLMLKTKVIPLFYEADTMTACQLIDACFEGGARVIEFTNRGDQAALVFSNLIEYCEKKYPELALGVGSIANTEQVDQFLKIGAHFLVSPFFDQEIAKKCSEKNVLWTGGCATLTEMHVADLAGVPIMKAFPGNILGPDFIKAAKAPCPWLKIMPTGGVKPEKENLTEWFQAGASCVGMGSKLFVKDAEGRFDYKKISELLQQSIQTAQQFN